MFQHLGKCDSTRSAGLSYLPLTPGMEMPGSAHQTLEYKNKTKNVVIYFTIQKIFLTKKSVLLLCIGVCSLSIYSEHNHYSYLMYNFNLGKPLFSITMFILKTVFVLTKIFLGQNVHLRTAFIENHF